MIPKISTLIIAVIISLASLAQDCDNYFHYQQVDSVNFNFRGDMYEHVQAMFSWDFGDGNTANGKIVSHTYAVTGPEQFTVCLYTESYDSIGNPCYDTTCHEIIAGIPAECEAFFFASVSPASSDLWFFTDFSSGAPTNFHWDFGDGNSSTLQHPNHTYSSGGNYNVCLIISDGTGNCNDTSCMEITVSVPNPECISDFTYNSSDLLEYDFEGFMVDTNQQALSYHWDFGDGTFGTGQSVSHTYTPLGSFVTVNLTTTLTFPNGDTCTHVSEHNVYVGTGPECQALFDWEYSSIPLTINFVDQSTGGATSWYWDFGDETHSVQQNPSHTFSKDDVFNVCLTITNDSNQCTSTLCKDINVNNLPPPVDCYNTFNHIPGANNFTFDFHGEAFSDTVNVSQTSTFNWHLGDGNTATGQDITHEYTSTGAYLVTLSTISILNGTDTCVAFSSDTIWVTDMTYCIGGYVKFDSISHADAGHVHLISYDAQGLNILNTETIPFESNGHYLFEDVSYGSGVTYYVQAGLSEQSAHYGEYVPTYHYDAIHWPHALAALPEQCPPGFSHNIILQQSTAMTPGTGNISGVVYSDDTKDIIENMEILLLNEDKDALMYVFTDENGMFDFNGVAFGSYYVYAELVGITTEGFLVTLTEDEQSVELNIVIGDGTASLSVEEYSLISIMEELYPNPANTILNLSVSAEKQLTAMVVVYNQLGQVMVSENQILSKGVNKIELDISDLQESVYYIRLQAPEGKPLMRSFVKIN